MAVLPKYWAVIPAAGMGHRFGAFIPKQYLPLNGRPVIEHTLMKFIYHPKIEKTALVIHKEDRYWERLNFNPASEKLLVTTGGEHRFQSVLAGLTLLEPFVHSKDFVLVHDAVRPCINHADINRLIDEISHHPVGGILGVRIRDTLKRLNNNNEIVDTVARENIWQALTPQMFRYDLLYEALHHCLETHEIVTDEAAAIEKLGFVPVVVEGRRDNIKITYKDDLELAQQYV